MIVPAARQPVIILGMHRSGTSMVSELLDQLGLFVGRELQDDHESTYFLELNEIIFERVHAFWDNPLPVRDFFAWEDAVAMTGEALAVDLTSRRIGRFFNAGKLLTHQSLEKFDKPWGWKDPRTVFTLPLWLRLFPNAKLIYIVRNAIDVASSLMVREKRLLEKRKQRFEARMKKFSMRSALERAGYKGSSRCLTLQGGFDLWVEYVRQADENLRGISNAIHIVRYEDFLKEPRKHLENLARFCELKEASAEKLQKAVAQVNGARALAYTGDPVLSAFYDKVKDNPWMQRYGYQLPMTNPLHALHQQAEAEFQPYGEVEIVSTFGEPQAEYAAIRKSAALIDLPQRGFIELTGRDRLAFLNNLLSNQTYNKETKTGMAAGSVVYAFILNARSGRIIADMNVIELGERTLLELDGRLSKTVRDLLEKYLFSEQVKISDQSEALHEIAIHGPGAADLIGGAIAVMSAGQRELFGGTVTIWRDDPAAVPGYHLIIPTDAARSLWMNLLAQHGIATDIGKRALRPAGWAAFNAARIEGGRPIFGIDFDDTILPAETGQTARAVSFTKGCYAGQEIVARMHAQQVAKQLVGIRFADDALPVAGAPVYDDQSNVIGGITSSTISPILSNVAIALGLVRKQFIPIGTVVTVPAEGQMRRGVVAGLPFVKAEG